MKSSKLSCKWLSRDRVSRFDLEEDARTWVASHGRRNDPARERVSGARGPNPYICDLCGVSHNRAYRCSRSDLETAALLRRS